MADTLTVYLSGDSWNGNAQATLDVNGVALPGVMDVQASNTADDVEAFTFTGNFGASPTVALSFINDAYGGSPSMDRNLYLDGFSYDGVAQLGDKKELGWNQTDTYTLSATAAPAMRAADFENSVGVDVHLDYWDTAYGLSNGSGPNTARVAASIAYLGADHIRIGVPTVQTLAETETLMAAGVKFDVLMPSTSSSAMLPAQLAALAPIAGAIAAIEGPNEVNLTSDFAWNGQTGLAAGAAYQQALDAAVKADPVLAGKPVYSLTLGGVGADGYTGLGNLSAAATDGTMHIYYINGTPPASTIQYAMGLAAVATPNDPVVITETNYNTFATAGSVSNAVQASYDLDLLMDAAKDGVAATYLYELLDESADPNHGNAEAHYGLFNSDGTPKPAATGIHNLMQILGDSGASASSFTTSALAYTVSGLPASGDSLLLEKSNGAHDLVVWAEPEIWNAATNSPIAATPRAVTVNFATSQSEVKIFDPLTGTAAIADDKNVSSVTVSVTDHPLIIEVEPPAPTAPVPTPPAPTPPAPTPPPAVPDPTTVGSGPDTLALHLSEDAFQGNAQFTVRVDGNEIGGTMTATASHASGQSQTLDVLGSFAAGSHTLAIDFLNDLYSPGVGDRNLFLGSASLNGAALPDSALSLWSGGTQSLSFLGPATTPAALAPIGSGPDTLALHLSEDAFQGDAQFTVSVDGKQVGGTMTATASHASGQNQTLDVLGAFAGGTHTLAVDFVNDAYQAGVGDRNLYLDGVSLDGAALPNSALSLTHGGTQSMAFIGATPAAATIGSGSDTLALNLSEDAYLGDAQYTVSLDGKQVGGTMSATATHAAGQTQLLDVLASLGAGTHTLALDFLNDAYRPGVGDRNLYLNNASLNNVAIPHSALSLTHGGTQAFDFIVPATPG